MKNTFYLGLNISLNCNKGKYFANKWVFEKKYTMKKLIKLRNEDSPSQLVPNSKMSIVEQIFVVRGVNYELETNYSLKSLSSSDLLFGVNKAVTILIDSLEKQQRVLIVGDFDADGATSCAVGIKSLKAFGYKYVDYLVPNRFEYGYGLTPEIVHLAAEFDPDIIITVDNGISSLEGVKAAKSNGYKVIVTDHHLPGRELPAADAIVNPNQPNCTFPSKSLAGVGVIFYLMTALRTELRKRNWFSENAIVEPNMAELLDLVALGTVADVVPLDHNNRILVSQGIARINAGRSCPGIQGLLAVSNRDPAKITASDLGFAIGPRLNAAGRLDDMSLGIQCLLSNQFSQAQAIASELDDLNKDRQSIEASIQKDALKILDSLKISFDERVPLGICLYQSDWHQGVIGIVASRIKDKFHRPTIVFAETDSGELKGSGRSIEGVHLRDVLDEVASQNPGLLDKFGGHAMAAGLSLDKQSINEFEKAFNAALAKRIDHDALIPVALSDGELFEDAMIIENAELIQKAGPWGQHFPEPSFHGTFHLIQQKIVGEKHLKLVLSPTQVSSKIIDAIAFNVDTEIWPNGKAIQVKMVYRLSVNEFRGQRNLQFIVDYLEPL